MSTFTDSRDGNTYKTVEINNQTQLIETLCANLKNLNDKVNKLEKKLDSMIIEKPCKDNIIVLDPEEFANDLKSRIKKLDKESLLEVSVEAIKTAYCPIECTVIFYCENKIFFTARFNVHASADNIALYLYNMVDNYYKFTHSDGISDVGIEISLHKF